MKAVKKPNSVSLYSRLPKRKAENCEVKSTPQAEEILTMLARIAYQIAKRRKDNLKE